MVPEASKTGIQRNLLLSILIIVSITQLIYLNSLSNQFVYDDEFVIVDNFLIKQWNHIPSLFCRDYFMFSGELSYRPFVTLTYFIDYTFWKLNPFGFHLTNNLLHTLNAVLLYLLLLQLCRHRIASFTGALIFSCHPILSEGINAVSFREDLLATTFFLLAFFLYVKTKKKDSVSLYILSVICYLLGVFSKEMAITLPIVIFFYDVLFTKISKLFQNFIRYYSGYIVVAIFYLLIRFVFLHNPVESTVSYPGDSIVTNAFTMVKVLVSYIKLLIFPFQLKADYVILPITNPLNYSFLLSFLFISVVIFVTYKLFFISKNVFFSIIWFFCSLLPILNIVPIENIMAERYLYLPILGFCMFGGNLAALYCRKIHTLKKTYIVFALSAVILITFSFLTIQRNKVWKNQTILWFTTAHDSPRSFKAHNNLGNYYRDAGRLDEAIREFNYALSLYENYTQAHNNLGIAYRRKGMLQEAYQEYQKALELNPNYYDAHNNLGVLYTNVNKFDLAAIEFKNAIAIKPYNPEIHSNLGALYATQGKNDLAVNELKKALVYNPDYFEARNNLAAVYIRQKQYKKAINECIKALQMNNKYVEAYDNLRIAYLNDQKLDKAREICRIILSLDPNHQGARKTLNVIQDQRGVKEKN